MFIVDRYVLWLFTKVFVVCFLSLTGLFIVIDGFGNLDEFLRYSKTTDGGVLAVLYDYYAARVLTFFDHTSPILALAAAICAITWMQRNNELAALLAAGVNIKRIIKPLIIAVVVVSLLAVVNREILIPSHRDKLARNVQDWMGDTHKPLRPQFDHKGDFLISGRHTIAAENKIVDPTIRLFSSYGQYGRQIVADHAVYVAGQGDRPAGYLLNDVEMPVNSANIPSYFAHDQKAGRAEPIILSPSDTPWLDDGQLFIVSGVDFDYLTGGSTTCQYSSSLELLAGLRNPSLDYGADVRVAIHARMLQPFLDAALLFIGLPLVLSRESRNVFVAAGAGLLIVVGFFIVVLACHGLGASGLVRPSLAAWCPLIIFLPIAYWLAGSIFENEHDAPPLTPSAARSDS